MKIDRYYSNSIYSDAKQVNNDDEGGFNLVGLTETIVRRWLLILLITLTTTSLAIVKVLTSPVNYKAYFEILSEPVTIETKVASGSEDSKEEIFAVELDDVQLKILTSPRLINPVVEKLKFKYPELNYSYLIEQLDVQSNEDNNILTVFYQHPNEEQVEDVLKQLSQTYLDYSLQTRQSGVNRGIEFVDRQLPSMRSQVQQLQQQLKRLRQQHNFINPDTQAQQLAVRLDSLKNQKLQIESQLDEAKNTAWNLQRELTSGFNTSSTALEVQTEGYSKLLEDLRNIDGEIARKTVLLSDNHPELQVLRQQKQQIITLIDRETDTLRNKVNSKTQKFNREKNNIEQKIVSLEQEIKQWSTITRDYNDIQRQLTLATDKLNEFAIQRGSLQVDAAQTEAPWKLLTPVTSLGLNSASMVNYGILGSGFGLLLGIGFAVTLDKYRNKIYSANQVKQVANLPVLGMIPYEDKEFMLEFSPSNPNQSKALTQSNRPEDASIQLYQQHNSLLNLVSSSVEAFRFLGANLGLFESNNPIKSFMITSTVTGEGKSTVSFNLAKTVANIGQRVLLVDTDLRSEYKLSDRMGLSNTSGLSNFLLEPNSDFQNFIQKSPVDDNLSILTVGNAQAAFDPNFDLSRLLTSPRMQALSEKLREHFDLIIYDVSPMVGYADVSLLKSQTDGVVLVTGLGKVESLKLKEALNQLEISNTPVLGVVMNQIKPK